jgi:hypothetical protein
MHVADFLLSDEYWAHLLNYIFQDMTYINHQASPTTAMRMLAT